MLRAEIREGFDFRVRMRRIASFPVVGGPFTLIAAPGKRMQRPSCWGVCISTPVN